MEQNTSIKAGDVVVHKHLAPHRELYVAACNGQIATTRYYMDQVFYTNEFFVDELEIYSPAPSNIGILSGIR